MPLRDVHGGHRGDPGAPPRSWRREREHERASKRRPSTCSAQPCRARSSSSAAERSLSGFSLLGRRRRQGGRRSRPQAPIRSTRPSRARGSRSTRTTRSSCGPARRRWDRGRRAPPMRRSSPRSSTSRTTAITQVVMGDTDRTPDGGISAGFLGAGAANLRKVGAYRLPGAARRSPRRSSGVPVGELTVQERCRLGRRQERQLRPARRRAAAEPDDPGHGRPAGRAGSPSTGNPPTKPVSQYTVVGTSQPMADDPADRLGHRDVRRGRRAARGCSTHAIVHPKTLGSTLVSVGQARQEAVPEHADRGQGQPRRRSRPAGVHGDPGGAVTRRARRSGPIGPAYREAATRRRVLR